MLDALNEIKNDDADVSFLPQVMPQSPILKQLADRMGGVRCSSTGRRWTRRTLFWLQVGVRC